MRPKDSNGCFCVLIGLYLFFWVVMGPYRSLPDLFCLYGL